ncbi:MAG: DEAD/DEAH box helicase, partial [SAR202 cluster bacterium]|nr:DEAD/DEAH box helicase [SAR202 cluster bacterium]
MQHVPVDSAHRRTLPLLAMSLDYFHPIVRAWFERKFGVPTEAQALGWPAIAGGRHTLIAAPTGSGKTLAAFLTGIDSLVRQALTDDGLPAATQILYVSPLKALANDIQRNLLDPLAEITKLAEEMGTPIGEIRAAVRTGDTSTKERADLVKRPPHILITTPESFYILLTAERSRRALKHVRTLILDELHAVAPNKRGAHLSLSVERLAHLAERPVTRIGLSATQKPIEEVARFLTGVGPDGAAPECAIVNAGHRRAMDLTIELPLGFEMGPIATHEEWAQVLDQITAHVERQHVTLLFVNTRRLVERVAHLMSERLGEEHVVAHHGSLSRETRFDAEQKLKAGKVKLCVATASLELGIDIGDVDLVCQIGSPRNIGVALQRVGRSGHRVAGTPKGIFLPLTRDEMVETVALLRAIANGKLDALRIPPWPLDILSQQIVAACVSEEWDKDALFATVTRAYPYAALTRERFDQVIAMLSEGVATRWGRGTAYLHRDGVHRKVKARRGARIVAVTSGGAIPDTGDYAVIAEPEGSFVGSVNEDFAVESVAGDIFLLGNTPWKIRRVEAGTVRVEAAHGQAPTIPFWLGEAPGRTVELSMEVSALRAGIDRWLPDERAAVDWLVGEGVDRDVASQVVSYVAEGKRVLGIVPTAEKLVAERFFDEAGGMQLVIHSPWGSRINRAWGLALRKRFCQGFNFELQAAATEEGINISLGPQHSFPVAEVFRYLKIATVEEVLLQAVLQAPLFGTRWRWDATRSLALLRFSGGKRVPTFIQRMRSDDLLAAVFPHAAACQDNRPPGGKIEPPDHPIVFEALRDCLTEAMDFDGLKSLLAGIESGAIETYGKDTVQPSVFCHQLLNAMPYAFLDDAPLEERRARAVTLRRALPEHAQDLGTLNQDAILAEAANAWPPVRDADELHDALLSLVVLPEAEGAAYRPWFDALAANDRALTLRSSDRRFWVAAERAGVACAAYPGGDLSPEPPAVAVTSATEPEQAVLEIVRGRVEVAGPFTIAEFARLLALPESAVQQAVIQLETQGLVLRGQFRAASLTTGETEFCDRRILARIHRATLAGLRREIEPVPPASFIRFLLEWQHATPATRLAGDAGLLETLEQLQGFEAAAAAWEQAILPSRVKDYAPAMLDSLCFGGEAVWGRFARRAPGVTVAAGLSRNGPIGIALRDDVEWLLDPAPEGEGQAPLTGAAQEVVEYLRRNGASFQPDIASGTKRMPSEVEDALWQLVAAGLVTADGFGALRGLITGLARKVRQTSRFQRRPRARVPSSRWALLRSDEALVSGDEELAEARAAQLLRRYGVLTRELVAREPMAAAPGGWRL